MGGTDNDVGAQRTYGRLSVQMNSSLRTRKTGPEKDRGMRETMHAIAVCVVSSIHT